MLKERVEGVGMLDLQESSELDNLLSDKKMGFGRARDLLEEYAVVCSLETQFYGVSLQILQQSKILPNDSQLPKSCNLALRLRYPFG